MSRFVLQLSEVLAEMESLQEELKHRKEQADIQKNLIAEAEEKQQKTCSKPWDFCCFEKSLNNSPPFFSSLSKPSLM